MKLDDKQQKFVEEYVKTFDIAGSARTAGYDRTNASTIGYELLCNENIQQAIEETRANLNKINRLIKFDKDDLVRVFWNMYNDCIKKGKIKDAKEIIETIAKWNGVEPDKVKTEIATLCFNIEDKI